VGHGVGGSSFELKDRKKDRREERKKKGGEIKTPGKRSVRGCLFEQKEAQRGAKKGVGEGGDKGGRLPSTIFQRGKQSGGRRPMQRQSHRKE